MIERAQLLINQLTTAGPNIMIPAFIFGIIGSQFLGNYLASRTVQI